MAAVRTVAVRVLFAIAICYLSWLGMMAIHELGHVVGAWATGARVISVSVPLLGFSQTIVHPNPHELLVVWGGPVVGTVIPAVIPLIWLLRARVPDLLLSSPDFVAVANGSYIGLGWTHVRTNIRSFRRASNPRASWRQRGEASSGPLNYRPDPCCADPQRLDFVGSVVIKVNVPLGGIVRVPADRLPADHNRHLVLCRQPDDVARPRPIANLGLQSPVAYHIS
jgi:hypothetical protein